MSEEYANANLPSPLEVIAATSNNYHELCDPSTKSNIYEIDIMHIHADLFVHFNVKQLTGAIEYRIQIAKENVTKIILDTYSLNIKKVLINHHPVEFSMLTHHNIYGTPLCIPLQSDLSHHKNRFLLRIEYETTEKSSALQWLPPEQTLGKVHPFLFSQCQPIHARSLFPCQDSPAKKFTYTAVVKTPSPLTTLMSAQLISTEIQEDKNPLTGENMQYRVSHFTQRVPIPSYLFAIASGDIHSRRIGPRSFVHAEKEVVEKAAWEFNDIEKFITTAEELVGPYAWGNYDLLLLPPSSPYGGIEHPNVTFLTPTILAGDKSLLSVVAHEYSHSYFGNYVTNHNWSSFWVNESFTVFLERKILAKCYSKSQSDVHLFCGLKALQNSISLFGEDHDYTTLSPNLTEVDPDDAFSTVPYEKGFHLLRYLESLMESEDQMNEFLRSYLQQYAYSTVTGEEFKKYFMEYFSTKLSKEKLDSIDWHTWYHKPGMPMVVEFDRSLINKADQLAVDWINNPAETKSKSNNGADIADWDVNQIIVFLEKLHELQTKAKADSDAMANSETFKTILLSIDETYNFTKSTNSEVRLRWFTLAIHSQIASIYPAVISFLSEQGRMKFIRPLYRDLNKFGGPEGQRLALETFIKYRNTYHAIAQKMVARDLNVQ